MKKIILLISIIGGISLVIYTDSIISSESLYPQPGTYAYFVSVPSLIRSLPQPQQIGQATYSHTAGDGTKVPEDEVSFLSAAVKENILRQIEDYLTIRGLKKLDNGTDTENHTYVGDDLLVEIRMRSKDHGNNEVVVSQTY